MLSQSDEFQVDTVLAFTDGAGSKLPNFENGCFETGHVTYYPKDDYYPETKYECVWKYIQIPIQVYWWEQARGGLYFEINTTCTEYPSGIVIDNEEDEENEEKRIE